MPPILGTELNKTHPLSRGLIAYWTMMEGAGAAHNDVTGNNNVATFGTDRVARWQGSPNGAGAVSFNRQLNQVTNILTPSTELANLSGECTVSAWVKFTTVGDYRYIVSDYNTGGTNAQFSLVLTNANKFTFFWARSGTQYPNPIIASDTTAVVDRWYHVTGVRRGSTNAWTCEIYVDGRLERSQTTIGNPNKAGLPSIGGPGSYVSANLSMYGNIKDVRIYNRALMPYEVQALYTSPYEDFGDLSSRIASMVNIDYSNSNFFIFF